MLFNSQEFFILLLATFTLYYLPVLRKYQVYILILSSLSFYAYGQPYLLLLLLTSAVATTYFSYKVIVAKHDMNRKTYAVLGVVFNLLVLAFFKYNKLLVSSIEEELSSLGSVSQILFTLPLPIGISFFTFQGISLAIDVYKKGGLYKKKEQFHTIRHLKNTVFYITFFPQLVAGPIVKAHDFFPQIMAKRLGDVEWYMVFKIMVTGYFLKVVIADNLQDQTFWISYPYFVSRSSLELVFLLFGYSIQIFADFAGYSLIAISLGAIFGYRLPTNFNFPYISSSVAEFWRRWHISLSSFLKEYLYFPLGGNRKGDFRTQLNLLAVMGIGGLWHGAAWSYVVWGLVHGFALVLERPIANTRLYTSRYLPIVVFRIALVFVFVTFSWLLFKLPNFTEVIAYIGSIGSNTHFSSSNKLLLLIIIFSLPIVVYHIYYLVRDKFHLVIEASKPMVLSVMLFLIITNSGNSSAFVYFQF